MTKLTVSILIGLFAFTGCASTEPLRFAPIPERAADLLPVAQARSGVIVAVDELSRTRAERYFGTTLHEEGILPVNIVVSNRSQHRVLVKPADVVLLSDQSIVDPLPPQWVAETVKRHHRQDAETQQYIDRYMAQAAFESTELAPNESYQGMMFFSYKAREDKDDNFFSRNRFFSTIGLFGEGVFKLRVGVASVDTGDRLSFGPYSVGRSPD